MKIVEAILPVLIVIAIGNLVREKDIISSEGINGLQKLVMNITLPVSLFANFYKSRLSLTDLVFPVTLFAAVILGIFVTKALCRIFHIQERYAPFLASGYEAGMLGFALMGIISNNIQTFAMLDIGQEFAIFTVYLTMLRSENGQTQSPREILSQMLHTPVLIATLTGLLVGTSGLGEILSESDAGMIIDAVCSFISAPTATVILVVIGYRMQFRKIDFRTTCRECLFRIALQTAFAVLILTIYSGLGGIFSEKLTTLSVLVMLILPPPFIVPLYVDEEEQRQSCASMLSLYTVITIALFSALIIYATV